jgi:hypothetical protein
MPTVLPDHQLTIQFVEHVQIASNNFELKSSRTLDAGVSVELVCPEYIE